MNTRLNALVAAAMESAEIELAGPVAPVDPTVSDAAVGVVDDSHREIEAAVADTETLEEVHEGLEALAASLESLSEPLNTNSATFVNIAAESHLARVGLDMSDAPIIASFENEETAPAATKSTLDSVKTKIRAIWEAIKAMWNKFIGHIKNFFKHVTDANHSLAQRASALEAKINGIHGEAAKEQEVDIGHILFARLHVGGKIDGAALTKGLKDVAGLVQAMGVKPSTSIDSAAKITLTVLRANSEADIDAGIAKLREAKFPIPAAFSKAGEGDDAGTHFTEEMPGGVKYGVKGSEAKEGQDGIEHLKNLIGYVGWHKAIVAPHAVETTKAPTLTAEQMREIVQTAKEVAKQGSQMKAAVDGVMADIENVSKDAVSLKTENVGEAGAKKITAIYSALSASSKVYLRIVSDAAAYSTRVLHGYITYAEKSAALFEAKHTEEEAKAADKVNEDASIGAAA